MSHSSNGSSSNEIAPGSFIHQRRIIRVSEAETSYQVRSCHCRLEGSIVYLCALQGCSKESKEPIRRQPLIKPPDIIQKNLRVRYIVSQNDGRKNAISKMSNFQISYCIDLESIWNITPLPRDCLQWSTSCSSLLPVLALL